MSARILVVDDVIPNVKILEAKLSVEYYDVVTAYNGPDALEIAQSQLPDLILLDVMMPQMDGFEVCRCLKADQRTAHIPVVMVTALSEAADRVQGLESGADDFLTKPVDDLALFARVKSLLRLKMMMDEFRLREETSSELGVISMSDRKEEAIQRARILVIDDNEYSVRMMKDIYAETYDITLEPDMEEALVLLRGGDYDLAVVSLDSANYDPLRLCSKIRSLEETRQLPILTLVDDSDRDKLIKGMEIGVNDYVMRPIDANELIVRTRTQILRKQYQDRLRHNFHRSMELAVTDSLTGLYNRRYMSNHLDALLQRAKLDYKPVCVMIMDIDFFKRVNDTHGHDVGDEVIREFSERIGASVRGIDLACRYGGEEFVVVMPDTDLSVASTVSERLRRQISEKPFSASKGALELDLTCSIGVTVSKEEENSDRLLKRADEALYKAKGDGRNRVVVAPSNVETFDRAPGVVAR
ncbi:PleD family two-component system response regulator [Sneathiella sp. HT1-7]|uniref:PleD family two-component system response regulator n=1 Tax=Sneathiella sp. HT1-7 TaxID=2887192 RepID=UPI001D143828|nr:PleD family two-component system response regulator [Sneathiella sp. HT1-7]MCC3304708.1 PleD family two-component system response regulator [Sneathiella sp. HT1-7]